MFQRVRRPVTVAIDGRLVPEVGGRTLIEKAAGERDLYRQLAMLGRSPAAVARAASRWGLLARTTPLLPVLAPGLAEAFATYRDGLARDAAASMAGEPVAPQTKVALGATGRAFEKILQLVVRKIAARIGLTAEDLAELEQRVDQLDWSGVHSGKEFMRLAARETESFRATHALPSEPQPLWAQEWDAAGDMSERIDRLGDDLDRFGTATTRVGRMQALRRLLGSRPPSLPSPIEIEPEALSDALAPLLQLADRRVSGSPAARPADLAANTAPEAATAAALLAYWQLGDSLVLDGPSVASVPHLGDADTWRTLAVLGHASQSSSGETGTLPAALIAREHASDWANFAGECALWRDAIGAMGRAQAGDTSRIGRDSLSGALRALELRLVSMRVLPDSAGPELDAEPAEDARERLLRWVTARCADAGVEPCPRSGLVGTEGRALWSIRDALMTRSEPRFCEWPDCREPLPPGSYAHRKYCDAHRRELNRRRTAARRIRGVPPA